MKKPTILYGIRNVRVARVIVCMKGEVEREGGKKAKEGGNDNHR